MRMKVFRVFMVSFMVMTAFCSVSKAAATAFYSEVPKTLKISVSRSNPDIMKFSIPAAADQKVQLMILNQSGAVISSEEKNVSDLQIDIKTLKSDGMYTFTVIAAGQKYSSKAVVML
jgi:hypothetical protein